MKLFDVTEIEEARSQLRVCLENFPLRTELVSLQEATGRVLAEDVCARGDIPAFSRSTVDGYAVVSKDTAAAGEGLPVFLTLRGTVEMGKPAEGILSGGECMYVPTGGMIPTGADGMVMVEYCEPFPPQGIAVYQAVAPLENVVQQGEDIKDAQVFLKKGTRLRPQEIGALAAAGIAEVSVIQPLKAAILSTGDEIISIEEELQLGQVRDINSYALAALAEKNGYQVTESAVVKDDEQHLAAQVRKMTESNDVVLVSGGSSQGNKDATAKILDQVSSGNVFIHGLAMKPGKPTILSYDKETKTILVGLPGHPVAAMLVFAALFSWLGRQYAGQGEPLCFPATMAHNLPGSPGRTTYQPVRLTAGDHGYQATAVYGKSGLITSLTQADGYVIMERNSEGMTSGQQVMVHLM